MSPTDAPNKTSNRGVKMNLEVQIIPVSDVDRAKGFYQQLGWRLDDDVAPLEGLRIVQLTPPGSGTSITFGQGLTTATPGAAEGGLTVSDIEVAHKGLANLGIEVSDVWHGPPFPIEARQPGPDPEHDGIHLHRRPGERPVACRGGTRRAPKARGAVASPAPVEPRRELARLVCLLHRGGAGRN
jgi:catechol 2,3-dioxygenase-like lactoylglutathione lyase family enzyme